ncbi:MAG TPA: hypothetical protein H9671_10350 [Firmicutes bacterium]|nr:hypothetical protein [Bacillota bacterium]
MGNSWEEIDLNDYESHMGLASVYQLQVMNQIMKEQFYTDPVKTMMILGIAGGNGLEHISRDDFETVYGVDVNQKYLDECQKRYPQLLGMLETICMD